MEIESGVYQNSHFPYCFPVIVHMSFTKHSSPLCVIFVLFFLQQMIFPRVLPHNVCLNVPLYFQESLHTVYLQEADDAALAVVPEPIDEDVGSLTFSLTKFVA